MARPLSKPCGDTTARSNSGHIVLEVNSGLVILINQTFTEKMKENRSKYILTLGAILLAGVCSAAVAIL
jgi:hypothetical protein